MRRFFDSIVQRQRPVPQVTNIALIHPGLTAKLQAANIRRMNSLNALGNTSRLFRSEFRTIQNRQLHVYINIYTLKKYLKVFFSGADKLGMGDHPAKLTVIFCRVYHSSFNILDLMEVLERAPSLRFDVFILNRKYQVCDEYQAAFAIIFGPLRTHTLTVLAGKIDSVRILCYHSPSLNIWIKPEHSEAWMSSDSEYWPPSYIARRSGGIDVVEEKNDEFFPGRARRDKTREWLRNAGVKDDLDGSSVILEI